MKNFLMVMAILMTACVGAFAETKTDSWALGMGLSYPRYYSVNIDILNSNFGGYISIQRNFTERMGLRLKTAVYHMEGQWDPGTSPLVTEKTNLVTFDLDWLYYISPCESISPYVFAGAGGNYKTTDYAQTVIPDNDRLGLQLNAGIGVEAKLAPEWNLVTEFGYYSTVNSSLDGSIVPSEINGRDSYFVVSAGVNYIFGEGKISELCTGCGEGTAMNSPDAKNAVKKPLIDDYIIQVADDRLIMVGVNFEYGKSRLLQESYEVLDKAVRLFISRPVLKVEIEGYGEGYTKNTETGTSNLKLSQDRAQAIKDYFVSKGVAAGRLTTAGYGMKNPFGDNKTPEARAMNKRIMLRIIK